MKHISLAALRLLPLLSIGLLISSCGLTPTFVEKAPVIEEPVTAAPDEDIKIPSRPFPDDSFYDLLVAEFAVRRNRYDLALGNYLQQAHQTRDAGVTARATRLAQFLQADNATLDAAQLWVELDPNSPEAHYTTATMLAKNQRPLEALQHMTAVLEQQGKTNFAAIAASTLQMPEATRQQVELAIDQLITKYPDNGQIMTSKALFLQQRGEPEAALALIQQVLKLNEQDFHAVVIEARLLQQLGHQDKAFVRMEKVVQQFPRNRRLRLQYARMLMSQDIVLAKQQFETLLLQSPNDPDLLLSLGLISRETKNNDDAQDYFQRLLVTGKRSTEAYYYLGQLAEQQQNWQQAIDFYRQIPPSNDFIAATNRIITLYMRQQQGETAHQYLQSLRQQYPEHAVRLYLMESELLLKQNQLETGQELLTEALLIYPQHPNLLYVRSMFSEKRGNLVLMEQDLRAMIQQDDSNALALNALGYVLANRTDRFDEAYQLISRALAVKPDDPAILDSLGWVEFRRGNLPEALALLQRAYAAFADHEVAAHLGEVLWQLDRRDEAIAIWQKALSTTPDSRYIAETVQRLGAPVDIPAAKPTP